MISEAQAAFHEQVFEQSAPACLKQGSWQHDQAFLRTLHQSWIQQYLEYLGEEAATSLVEQLISDGSLYTHDPALTLQAWVDGQRVGIASLRVLNKDKEIALITMLEVDKRFHHRGIGSQLVQALSSASTHLMAHVSIHRPQVKVFYEKLGFRSLERCMVDHYGHELEFDVVAR